MVALSALLAAVGALGLAGCAAVEPRNPVPNQTLAQSASLPDIPGVRAWADEAPADVAAEVRRRAPTLPRLAQRANRQEGRPIVDILALSGGGADGAFGAGVLAGWSARGDRPQFEIVTGVSAGAIIAPFAFLGSRYDSQLREIWTRYQASEIVTAQILPGLLGGSALVDTGPLVALIAQYVDERLLAAVASQYREGRLLLVGTTNLDAQRPVVWNMGGIAASGHPQALELFRKVLLASSAIPGIFPPVSISVRAGGKSYDEMHVDGGTTREVFVSPLDVPLQAFDPLYDAPPIRRIFVIKNGKLAPEYAAVEPQVISIAARAISTLTKAQSQAELYRIWRMANDASADFNLIAIPKNFRSAPPKLVEPDYQAALFAEGLRLGRSRSAWMKQPSSPTAAGLR